MEMSEDDEDAEATEAAEGAAALFFKLMKELQNAADGAKLRDLQGHIDNLDEGWHHFLRPQGQEPRGPGGSRWFACFAGAFGGVVLDAADAEIRQVGRTSVVGPVLDDQSMELILDSHVWTAPVSAPTERLDPWNDNASLHRRTGVVPPAKVPGGRHGRQRTGRSAVATYLRRYRRPSGGASASGAPPVVPYIATFAETVRQIARPEMRRNLRAVGLRADDDLQLSAVFQAVLAAAADRFTSAGGTPLPIHALMRREIRQGGMEGLGLCARGEPPHCTGRSDPPNCSCWEGYLGRVAGLGQMHPQTQKREAGKGLVALQIATWQFMNPLRIRADLEDLIGARIGRSEYRSDDELPPRFVPAFRRQVVMTAVSDRPIRALTDRGMNLDDILRMTALGDMITLQTELLRNRERGGPLGLKSEHSTILLKAASALDSTSDPVTLRIAATICSVLINDHRRITGDPILDAALGQLVRSVIGAFRELREPSLAVRVFQGHNDHFDWAGEMKLFEARQDLQLAYQRVGLWEAAASVFRDATNSLSEWFEFAPIDGDVFRRKSAEVLEQLHLGRLGGQALEAEALIRLGQWDRARMALESADANRSAIATHLQLLEGGLEVESGTLDSIPMEVDPVGLPSFLRYTRRWAIMPALMECRIEVASGLCGLGDGTAADHATSVVRQLDSIWTRYGSWMAERQYWEFKRIRAVASLFVSDFDLLEDVRDVVDAGGDDNGDYLLPTLQWAASLPRSTLATPKVVLDEAVARIRKSPSVDVPRLPDDLSALTN